MTSRVDSTVQFNISLVVLGPDSDTDTHSCHWRIMYNCSGKRLQEEEEREEEKEEEEEAE